MQVGDLVKSKWQEGIIGILIGLVAYSDDIEWGDNLWRVKWIGENVVLEETQEDEEDLEVICV
jgi:hypothetical protein